MNKEMPGEMKLYKHVSEVILLRGELFTARKDFVKGHNECRKAFLPIIAELKAEIEELKSALHKANENFTKTVDTLKKDKEAWTKALEGIGEVIRERLERYARYVDQDGICDWGDGDIIKHIGLPSIDTKLAQAIRKTLLGEK